MKNYAFVLIITAAVIILGCARVSVQAPKEPIKVDISMRLDVYQHVAKDIDAIENMVSGAKETEKAGGGQSFRGLFIATAYAQEELSPEVEQAALRRKNRIGELYAFESKGIIGENRAGLLELRGSPAESASARQLIEQENNDRMIIYRSVASKNKTSVEEVQKIYAKRLQSDAPSGTPIETRNEASGSYEWKTK